MENPAGTSAARGPAGPAGERELVERARAGDVHAFGMLVQRHQDRAHALALRIVRSANDAEEVAQDAFVRAWHALPGFRGDAAFATWLYRIVSRLSFDRAAQLRTRRERETDLDPAHELPATGTAGRSEADVANRRALEACVATLPEAQRAAVTLFYFQDRSVREVAASLGMNENTVKTHLSRARVALRSRWIRRTGASGT
jgi:RNA polymerase sigma-70 factor (ECF subfamily)